MPYEECKRWREEGRALPEGETVTPAYAVPPFHPGHPPRTRVPHRRTRRVDGALVSGALTALCVVTLIVTVVVAATLPA
ncbi:hypothetical protein GQF42_21490 [Streptomyces broussonetiae]|uniref:Uncharacterized protein n=1 Tax=Streptomyces broussonetiae TaxID=2686304 RepID=A0A6I6NHD3_9ACTN|nr:hypothetical protein GQF42_21490 [Streptomyces broussonetiae]